MAGDAFVVAKVAEDAEGESEAAFEIDAFGLFVGEGWRGGEFEHLCIGGLGVDFGFVSGGEGGLSCWAVKTSRRSGMGRRGDGFRHGGGGWRHVRTEINSRERYDRSKVE